MAAPRFADDRMISAELQINELIRQVSSIYGGFHGTNSTDRAHSAAYFDTTYMAAYIRHASGWSLIVPTNSATPSTVTANGISVTASASPLENGIYLHTYTVPASIEPGSRYKVVVTDSPGKEVYSPYETFDSADFATLNPFTSGSIPKDYREWNKVSDTIDILTDTIGLNAQGFLSSFGTIDNSGYGTEYKGTIRHSESDMLYNFRLNKPEYNKPNDTKCNYNWVHNCASCPPDNTPCYCNDGVPEETPCSQPDERDTWGTMTMRLQVEVPGSGTWTDIFAYNYLITREQIDDNDTVIPVEAVGLIKVGDNIGGINVTAVGTDTITLASPYGATAANRSIKTSISNSTHRVRNDDVGYNQIIMQNVVTLPTIQDGDIYNVRIYTWNESHEGNSHADLLIGYIGEIPGSTAISTQWEKMKRWDCGDSINGSGTRSMANIVSNIEYLKGFESVNYGSQKLRDFDLHGHVDLVFYRQKRFLSYYNEATEGFEEFEPTIEYFNTTTQEWVSDSLNTEVDTWHTLDLNTVDGLHSGTFYSIKGTSYALESGESA